MDEDTAAALVRLLERQERLLHDRRSW